MFRNSFELTKKGKFRHLERKSKRITKTKEKKKCAKHSGNFQASASSLYKQCGIREIKRERERTVAFFCFRVFSVY